MNIRVSISGPVMGDITISRDQDSGRCVTDGPDRDAEDCARMLEQIATDIRRMFPKPIAESVPPLRGFYAPCPKCHIPSTGHPQKTETFVLPDGSTRSVTSRSCYRCQHVWTGDHNQEAS